MTAYASEERYSGRGISKTDLLEPLKEICQRGGYSVQLPDGPSDAQRAELSGALVLCPDNATLAELVARPKVPFYGQGTFVVGEDIPPGTYRGVSTGSCYWELSDVAGNIIDNNFVGRDGPVEVTIPSDAYAFDSSNCGRWKPVG